MNDAACCAAFYDQPAVRYLLGDSWHPGGIESSLRLASHCALDRGGRVLDVACGGGTTLAALREAYPDIETVGMDVAPPNGMVRGDVHDMPFEDGAFDALFCECALSTFHDQPRALAEICRVLEPGGFVAISDMVVDGDIPETLVDWVHVGTCLSNARSRVGYTDLFETAGLRPVASWNADDGLLALLSQIKRRLLGAALAKASGMLPADIDIDIKEGRTVLADARRAIEDKRIGYHAFVMRAGAR